MALIGLAISDAMNNPAPKRGEKAKMAKEQSPQPQPPLTLEQRVARAQAKRDLWAKVAQSPAQTSESAAWAAQNSRTCEAAALLGQKAIAVAR
jgi:hypothetical protein